MRLFSQLLCLILLSAACSPNPGSGPKAAAPQLFLLQLDPAGGAQLISADTAGTIPLGLPSDCSIYKLSPNPVSALLAVELECDGGPVVELIDTRSGPRSSPGGGRQIPARVLAWSWDGQALYLKTDVINNPQIVRFDSSLGQTTSLDLPVTTYDLASLPDGRIVYSTTQGIGYGSETWLADSSGRHAQKILSEPLDIVAYLRPSPDGKQIAFIRFPDSQTPFPDGELWVMDASGKNARELSEADAGHGYAPAWNPDGTQLAFVVRENPADPQVEQSAGVLRSNVYRLEVQTGKRAAVTEFSDAIVKSPLWSPDGSRLAFNVARNDTIQAWSGNTGNLQPLGEQATCCAVWVPGR